MKTNGIKITKLSILKVLERQNTKMFLKFLEKKMVVFNIDDNAHENMEKAFKDEEADERKEWLKQYNPNARTFDLDSPNKNITT